MPGYGTHGNHHNHLADVLVELAGEVVEVDKDVIEVDEDTWAIHGRIAYDGEVLVAEFASEEEAWAALSDLTATDPDHTAPPT
jgi:hypothetical protein